MFTCPAPAPAAAGEVPTVLEGRPCHRDGHHQQSGGFGTEQGREGGSFSVLLLMWKSVSVHPRHSWGVLLPAAHTEGNASVLLPARAGHVTCAHRYRASPTSQVSTATQDSEYICSMWPVEDFLTKHRRSRFYLQ